MASRASKRVIYAALLGNLLVALTKFVAAALTGSSAMASEAVHSLVDTGNEVLLLYGLRRAARPPDDLHPLGHGRELYFWSFVVTILIFAFGASVSLYQGVRHIVAPVPMSSPIVNYVVLGLALVFEAGSFSIAVTQFRSTKGKRGYIEAARHSKDPTVFLVLFEDTAALIGVMIALAGIAASEALGRPELDGAASVGIGLLLGAVALFLARESKGLLIGEPADSAVVASICAIARAQRGVERANGLFPFISVRSRSLRRLPRTSPIVCPRPTWRQPSAPSNTASGRPIRRSCFCWSSHKAPQRWSTSARGAQNAERVASRADNPGAQWPRRRDMLIKRCSRIATRTRPSAPPSSRSRSSR
jgi:cation diffusion facilitator family transporter